MEGTDNIYGCEIPEGFTKVIFCRMNPAGDTNSWDKDVMWTQTANLNLTAGRVYTVEGWNSGSWSGEPAVVAPDEAKLYLKPNSNWTQSNARFAAYFFGDGDTWENMTDPDGDGIYEVVIPTDRNYTTVIFCRMNPNSTTNGWTQDEQKWNQTSDLAIPTDGNNLYTVEDGTWDKGNGTWSAM